MGHPGTAQGWTSHQQEMSSPLNAVRRGDEKPDIWRASGFFFVLFFYAERKQSRTLF